MVRGLGTVVACIVLDDAPFSITPSYTALCSITTSSTLPYCPFLYHNFLRPLLLQLGAFRFL